MRADRAVALRAIIPDCNPREFQSYYADMSSNSNWQKFTKYFLRYPELKFSIDISRMNFDDEIFTSMGTACSDAMTAMEELEKGAIANPDEGRMVGHYWLRDAQLAPDAQLRSQIEGTIAAVKEFADSIHNGNCAPPAGGKFTDVLLVGIGGSALGPQLIADAMSQPTDPLQVHFLDNTDPDGIQRVLGRLADRLGTTLCVVVSKSGGTKETRNGMLEAQAAYQSAGVDFASHAVAITGTGSKLDQVAESGGWLARFPMWDWVGGRTSVMSAVGLLPAALQGVDIDGLLAGATAMDKLTRNPEPRQNAAMLLALMWHHAGGGKGLRDMVILPYKDRLVLFSKYLQQLVMESLGKELDLDGKRVNQGIAVYGNKGSTDQHAYVQQLRDGINNFFLTFIEVRKDQIGDPLEVEAGITSGDYLQGFLRGTRAALSESRRESITLSVADTSAGTLGALIALYERAVGFYASLVNINAYHQPGVEAGKQAASEVLELQAKVIDKLAAAESPVTAEQIADSLSADPEAVYHILCHLAENRDNISMTLADTPLGDTFAAA